MLVKAGEASRSSRRSTGLRGRGVRCRWELEDEEFDGVHGKSNTEARRHGGHTEGLWPAGLRPAGRIGIDARTQVRTTNTSSTCVRASIPIRAARSAAPQAFSHPAFKLFR